MSSILYFDGIGTGFPLNAPGLAQKRNSTPVPTLDLDFGSGTFIPNVGPMPAFSRASAATYVGYDGLIATATTNNPRIDYDPVTLSCRGLLLEPAATNLILFSELFSDSSWAPDGVSRVSGATDPTGQNGAFTLTASSGSGNHRMYSLLSVGTDKCFSLYAKAGTVGFLGLSFPGGGADTSIYGGAMFDLVNGTCTVYGSGMSAAIFPAGNGFYRCCLVNPASVNYIAIEVHSADNQAFPWVAAGTETIIIYGAMCCEGGGMTSYIRTIGATATRSTDVCSISGSDFSGFYNDVLGTWVVDYESVAGGGIFSVNDNSSSNKIELNSSGGTLATVGGSDVSTMTGGVAIAAFVAAENDYQLWSNGVKVDDQTSVENPFGLTQVLLGALQDGSRSVTHIKRIRFYPSVLTAGQLATLTTPP